MEYENPIIRKIQKKIIDSLSACVHDRLNIVPRDHLLWIYLYASETVVETAIDFLFVQSTRNCLQNQLSARVSKLKPTTEPRSG